ncbi:hypothetical protein ABHA04_13125, partial [Clostridium tertium]|uniref:hypothetical protein n=1 Tax=Clostridium tertium TaxID=1559 RepID=UPI00325C0B8C
NPDYSNINNIIKEIVLNKIELKDIVLEDIKKVSIELSIKLSWDRDSYIINEVAIYIYNKLENSLDNKNVNIEVVEDKLVEDLNKFEMSNKIDIEYSKKNDD